MKSHVWRPLYVVIGLIAILLIAREFFVPKDFGIYERGFMYSFHRGSDQDFWKAFTVKYSFDTEYCRDCHADKYTILKSPHAIIHCENCHGPVRQHPTDPPKLAIDKSRELCLRCHYPLPYPTSDRAKIMGIDPLSHNPGIECSTCHNPHMPNLEAMK